MNLNQYRRNYGAVSVAQDIGNTDIELAEQEHHNQPQYGIYSNNFKLASVFGTLIAIIGLGFLVNTRHDASYYGLSNIFSSPNLAVGSSPTFAPTNLLTVLEVIQVCETIMLLDMYQMIPLLTLTWQTTNTTSITSLYFDTYILSIIRVFISIWKRIDDVSFEQSEEEAFQTAFVAALRAGTSRLPIASIAFTSSAWALYGYAADCKYFIEAHNTNLPQLTAVVRGSNVTDSLKRYLVAAGYQKASASAQAIIVDASPTPAPTMFPTYIKATVEFKQVLYPLLIINFSI